MKGIKKLLCVVLALVMVLGLSVTAFAAAGTVTVAVKDGITNGTISVGTATTSDTSNDTEVTITVTPSTGYQLKSGSLKATLTLEGSATTTDLAIANNKFTITAAQVTTGGAVEVTGEFEQITGSSIEGAGTNEGHLDKEVTSVVLPTVDASTFAYTMDAERLIQETSGKKYGDSVSFPDEDDDTGVYFQTAGATETYAVTGDSEAGSGKTYYKQTAVETPAANSIGTYYEYISTTTTKVTGYKYVKETATTPAADTEYYFFESKTVEDGASPAGLYVLSSQDYILTTDTTKNASTAYYERSAATFTETEGVKTFTTDKNYYKAEAIETTTTSQYYAKTEDKALRSGKTYYTIAEENTFATNLLEKTETTATYENKSTELTVTNKSSCAINLTVDAVAATGTSNITMVDTAAKALAAETASLYLGLKVGNEAVKAISTTKTSATVEIGSGDDNYKVDVAGTGSSAKYTYRALSLEEYKALDGNSAKLQGDYDDTWAKTTFYLEGAVSKTSVDGSKVAPTITVTWKWAKASAEPEAVAAVTGATISGTTITYTKQSTNNVVISPTLTSGVTITKCQTWRSTEFGDFGAGQTNVDWTSNNTKITVKNTFLDTKDTGYKIKVILSSGDPIEFEFTMVEGT